MYRMISPKFRIDLNLETYIVHVCIVGGFSQTFSCTHVFCISLSTLPPPPPKKETVHVRTLVYYYSCVLSVV